MEAWEEETFAAAERVSSTPIPIPGTTHAPTVPWLGFRSPTRSREVFLQIGQQSVNIFELSNKKQITPIRDE